MASESESRFAGAMRELFSFEMYKRSQGRKMRQLTAAGIGLFLIWGLKALSDQLMAASEPELIRYGVPLGLGLLAAWAVFRAYNWSRFADFLIATEAEMGKVSWSTKSELKRATAVVILTLFLLAGFLLSVDMAWSWVLEKIGVLQVRTTEAKAMLDDSILPAAWEYLKNCC